MKRIGLIAISLLFSSVAYADDNGIVKVKSNHSVNETINRVESIAKDKGFSIWVRKDFKKMGEKTKTIIKPNQLITFGKGKGGPKLIASSPTTSLDLPLRMISYEDDQGQVWLAYTTPDYWKKRHGISGKVKVIGNINKALKTISSEAVK